MKLSDFNFTQLDPADIQELLVGHTDILTPLAVQQHKRVQGHSCFQCGTPLIVKLAPRPFVANQPLPRYMGSCPVCKSDGILVDV